MDTDKQASAAEPLIAQIELSNRAEVFVDRVVASALSSPLGILLLAWVQAKVAGREQVIVWLCLMGVAELVMLGVGYRFRIARSRGADAQRWINSMTLAVFLAGLSWGSTVWLFWTEGQYLYYLLNLAVLVGVSGICVIVMSPFRMALALFTGGVLLLPVLHLVFVPNPFGTEIAVGLTIMFVLILQYGRVAELQLVRGIHDAVRNERLLQDVARRSAALEESQSELNRAQTVGKVGSWVYDLAKDSMRLSAETCRIFGLPEGTRGNHDTYLARVHPDDRERVDRAWQEALKGGKPFDDEHRIIVGKTTRWVRQKALLECSPDGTLQRSVGTTQEVTERREAEEAIAEKMALVAQSESRLARAMEASSDGLWEWDVATGKVYFSPAYYHMLGYEEGEFASAAESWVERLHPEDRARTLAVTQDCIAGRTESFVVEFRMRAKDGSWRWILGRGKAASRNSWGKATLMVGTHVDISERKKAEATLKLSEERLRTIIDTEPECVKVVDGEGRLVEMNAAGLAMIEARSLEQAQQRPLGDYLLPEHRNAFFDLHARVMQGNSGVLAFEIKGLKGTRRWLETHAAPMRDAAGNVVALLGVTRDITEQRWAEAERIRLETQLRESQKMEALGTLAGGVAHDFNNALATIQGNLELARQDVGPNHPALESLEEIAKASRRSIDLVQQILSFSRRQKLERKATSLALVAVETARLLRATLPAMVNLEVNCAADTPAVLADATQIKQILLNLANNAIHAIQDQGGPGTIEIRLSAYDQSAHAENSGLRPGRYACLSVRDNGPGMDAATRSHIFEPFFTTKPQGKGTGLGLAVVHGIAQEHAATIEVESAPGKGSVFRIYFPAIEAPHADAEQPKPASAQVDGAGKRVLYVDDEEAIIFLMKRLLERKGFRFSGYTDPHEALEAVRADPGQYDLAVTDYNMPGMSGLDVASTLRQLRADLPVVLASGYITEELRQKAPDAGIRELIYKPNTVEDLCEAVARYANANN